ncbi:hypothetical protein [Chamaesiphon polymorphus]|uniref:Uncharacterized protein n=1 Tax=Chamaesiphon polymorphus CCALA 037 TaxID=2107692 RepID=A0A2T1G8G3_9CYAN|nr:hypothetical protein [Chamaesiphon polymorphus]PSB53470.1 hypothetical protein C7B77_19510 [Chamaesiphon polymorphus CCALA 037]
MWALELLAIVLAISIGCQLLIFTLNFIFAGNKIIGGFLKGVKRHFLSSLIISLIVTGVCLLVRVPKHVAICAFFASFIGMIFILLGNDNDNDMFRKL